MRLISPRRLAFGFLSLCAVTRLATADLPPGSVAGDTFALASGHRQAGSDLIGQSPEVGGGVWTGTGHPIFTPEGSVTVVDAAAAMGLLPLAKPGAALDLSADLAPAGEGFAALALLPNDSPGDFWTTAAVWVLLHSNGDYEIYRQGTTALLKKGAGVDYAFKAGDYNHVELLCDPASKTVSVRLNGTVILSAMVLPDLPPLVCAAFRFNEKSTPQAAKLDNFAVAPVPAEARLTPVSSSQFYVLPGQTATLRWKHSPEATGVPSEVIVRDYPGREVSRLPVARPTDGSVEVAVQLPQGYYTLFFPQGRRSSGWSCCRPPRARRIFFCHRRSPLAVDAARPAPGSDRHPAPARRLGRARTSLLGTDRAAGRPLGLAGEPRRGNPPRLRAGQCRGAGHVHRHPRVAGEG